MYGFGAYYVQTYIKKKHASFVIPSNTQTSIVSRRCTTSNVFPYYRLTVTMNVNEHSTEMCCHQGQSRPTAKKHLYTY